jgi:hypothetical protein
MGKILLFIIALLSLAAVYKLLGWALSRIFETEEKQKPKTTRRTNKKQ